MSTKAGTIGLSGRPTGFVVWTAIVSTVAAAALIMSALALTRVGQTPATSDAANTDAYVKAFRPNDYVQFVQAAEAHIDAAEAARIYALRDQDSKTRGYEDTAEKQGWKYSVSSPSVSKSSNCRIARIRSGWSCGYPSESSAMIRYIIDG